MRNEGVMKKQSRICSYLKEYCDCSGVHGLRYLSEERRHWLERCFWVIAIVACAILCSIMIFKIKEKVDTTPVIVSFAESPTNVRDMPFPAVTLCPLSKCRQSLFNSTKYADMIKNDVDLRDDYELWVQEVFLYSCERVFHSSCENDETVSGCLVDVIFKEYVLDKMFSNAMSPELESLLKEIVMFEHTELEKTDPDVYNETIETMFPDLYGRPRFRRIMDGYYPLWRKDIELRLRSLNFVCQANVFNSSSDFSKMPFGYTNALAFLAKVAELDLHNNRNAMNKVVFDRSNEVDHVFEDFFTPTFTEEGLCFTFNKLNESQLYNDQIVRYKMPRSSSASTYYVVSPISHDWNPDSGYHEERSKQTPDLFPRRAFGVGTDSGLRIKIDQQLLSDIDLSCNPGGVTGYKVILHRPDEEPSFALNFAMHVPFYKEVAIAVIPSLLITSPELKDYHPRVRQCYYSYERRLDYFKFYSRNNCELECLTKAVLKKCGCVAFFMPRFNSTTICEGAAQKCVVSATKELEREQIREDLINLSEDEDGAFGSSVHQTECACLPSCLTMSYSAEVTMVDLNYGKHYKQAFEGYFDPNMVYTFINIFYKQKQFMSMKRSELFNQIDLLANSGGVLGLFSGFSMLSLIELIYFLTLRLWTNLCRRCASDSRLPKTKAPRNRGQVPPLIMKNEAKSLRTWVPQTRAPNRRGNMDVVLSQARAMGPTPFVYK